MIIVLEGPDGVGKSTIARELNNLLPLSNLIKLSGAPKEAKDKEWMKNIYEDSFDFLVALGNKSNVIMDRAWPSEWVYAPLFKGYFTDYIKEFQKRLHQKVPVVYIYLDASVGTLNHRIVTEKTIKQPKEKHPDWVTISKISKSYDAWFNKFAFHDNAQYMRLSVDEKTPKQVAEFIIKHLALDKHDKEDTYSKALHDVKNCSMATDSNDEVILEEGFATVGKINASTIKTNNNLKVDIFTIASNPKSRGFEHVIKSKRIGEEGFLPKRSTKNSAGYDFLSPINFILEPGEQIKIPLNIKAYMRKNEFLQMHIRSSIGINNNISLSNTTGIIDSDFYNNPTNDGNITLALFNYGDNTAYFERGDAIAQGIFIEYKLIDDDIMPLTELLVELDRQQGRVMFKQS